MDTAQEIRAVNRICPHCSNTVAHLILLREELPVLDESYRPIVNTLMSIKSVLGSYILYKCCTCHKLTLIFSEIDNSNKGEEEAGELSALLRIGVNYKQTILYPQVKVITEDVPVDIVKIYEEARRIKNLAPNAFATQIRKALEALCEEQGAPESRQIFDKLKFLSEQGKFPDGLLEMGHIIRKVSKLGAHPKDDDISSQEAEMLDDIFGLILDYVYITPAKVRALEAKISKKESKKE